METIQTLENVLADIEAEGFGNDPRVKKLVERAFRAGLTRTIEQVDPLAGYSNLTEAISAGEPIDWERLDGLKVQCVNPEVGTLRGKMERDTDLEANRPYSWWKGRPDSTYTSALYKAWEGKGGWSLWVEGEIPLRRKTADELELYTYFLGQVKGDSPYLAYVGSPLATDTKSTIFYAPDMLKSINPASDWVVLEEYGPFQKPEGK